MFFFCAAKKALFPPILGLAEHEKKNLGWDSATRMVKLILYDREYTIHINTISALNYDGAYFTAANIIKW